MLLSCSQLPTRRLTHAVLEDRAILVKCRLSPLIQHPQGVYDMTIGPA